MCPKVRMWNTSNTHTISRAKNTTVNEVNDWNNFSKIEFAAREAIVASESAANCAKHANKSSSNNATTTTATRCLSLVPNAANLKLDVLCSNSRVDDKILVDGKPRTALDLSLISKTCAETLQGFQRWHGQQFNEYSNVVTTLDCFTKGKCRYRESVNKSRW